MDAFRSYAGPLPKAPIRFVVLTSVDLYHGDANFVFAVGYRSWGALVSTARFGDPAKEQARVAHRAAKESLGVLVKSFGVPTSTDVNCVTSYTRTLDEFDRKGNRLSAESFGIFRQALRSIDQQWAAYREARRNGPGN